MAKIVVARYLCKVKGVGLYALYGYAETGIGMSVWYTASSDVVGLMKVESRAGKFTDS